jgi:hypothetical protein
MNPQPSWRDLAIACIANALNKYAELHLGKIDPKVCQKWISANWYPFGQRKYLLYKVWCNECAKISSFLAADSDSIAYLGWRNRAWFKKGSFRVTGHDKSDHHCHDDLNEN